MKCKDCKQEFSPTSGNEKYCTRCLAIFYMDVEQDEREGRNEYTYAEDNEPPRREE